MTTPTEELAKALRKLGYPEAEEGMKPSQMLPKAIVCVTKRLKKLAEYIPDTTDKPAPDPADSAALKSAAWKEALAVKTLGLPCPKYC